MQNQTTNLHRGVAQTIQRGVQLWRHGLPPRLLMLMSFAGTSITNYIFGLATGWLLVPGDFGLLAFTQTLLLICGLLLNSGFAWSLAQALVGADQQQRARLVRGSMLANLLLSFALSTIILALFTLGPLRVGLETAGIAILLALTLPLLSCIAIARATAQGYERFGLVALLQVIEVVGKAGAGIWLTWAGYGAAGAVAGFLVGALLATLVSVWLLVSVLTIRPWGQIQRPALRAAGYMFGALLGMALLLNLDIVMLKLLSGGDRTIVGHYQAGIVLANTPYYLTTAMIPILFTQIARHKDLMLSPGPLGEALRIALLGIIPIEGVLMLAPDAVLALLFPSAYSDAAPVLRILAVANCAIILVAIFSSTFQAAGHARIPARVLLLVTACETLALSFVVPQYGAQGAAITFLVTALIAFIVLSSLYLVKLGRHIAISAARWFAKYIVACSGAALIVGIVLAISDNLITALIFGGAAYVGLALGLGLITVLQALTNGSASRRLPIPKE